MRKKDNDGIERTLALFKTRQGLQEYMYEVMDTRILEFRRLYSKEKWELHSAIYRNDKRRYEARLEELLELKKSKEEEE